MKKLKFSINLIYICTLIFLTGCFQAGSVDLHEIDYQYADIDTANISIAIDTGQVKLIGTPGSDVNIKGVVADPGSLNTSQDASGLLISLAGSKSDNLVIEIPAGMQIDFETSTADLQGANLSSSMDIRSTSGDISIEAVSGDINIWAGRGDVLVTDGSGNLVVIGEHGVLSVEKFSGDVAITTIMGTVKFTGEAGAAGNIKLETDHGSVEAIVWEDSNLDVRVSTASGLVYCQGKDINPTVSGCQGVIGDPAGELVIRTVSGRVNLNVLSSNLENEDE